MPRYPYSALSHSTGSIRLLHLLPAKQDEDPLRCRISDHDIKQPNCVAYDALSYVWGDENKTVNISLENHVVPVTINLDAALRALRLLSQERVLWVDALCINQIDLQEKSSQVQRMWDIYSAAEQVIVWLGVHQTNSEEIMARFARRETREILSAKERRQQRRLESSLHNQGCPCVSGFPDYETPRIGLMSILAREWFTRIWTLQEVAAAKQVVIICGNSSIDGKIFNDEIIAATAQSHCLQKTFRKIRPVIELIGSTKSAFRRYGSPLVALVERFRSWNAKEIVDKVYALLAFSSDARSVPELLPDYQQTPYTLACKIIRFTYPSATIVEHIANSNAVTFEINGYNLGQVSTRTGGLGKNTWSYQKMEEELVRGQPNQTLNSVAASIFKHKWMIDIYNERKIDSSSTIYLLRDAVRPTCITRNGAEHALGMLATTEPYPDCSHMDDSANSCCISWADVIKYFSTNPNGAIKLRLTWDPFRQPLPTEVSSHIITPE